MGRKIKPIYRIGALLVVLVVCLLVSLPAYSGETSTSDAYDYPIKSGTDEWKAFTTHEEMLRACQIPEELLHRMSTTALVETVLNYPLSADWWSYDSFEIGIKRVADQFNGLSELLSRKDAGVSLIALYQTIDPGDLDINSPIAEQTKCLFRFLNTELLLSQDSLISNLSITDLQNLISRARIIYESKVLRSDIFGGVFLQFTSTIIEKASERQYSARWYYSYVYTPKGTAVEVQKDRTEFSPSQIQEINAYYQGQYPYAIPCCVKSKCYRSPPCCVIIPVTELILSITFQPGCRGGPLIALSLLGESPG